MSDAGSAAVSVSREIKASAATVFEILADPSRHPGIDGSGMVRSGDPVAVLRAVGDVFIIEMHNDEMGHYEMTNHVVEFEADRRIAWEPALSGASRPEDAEDVGRRLGHRWGYTLRPSGPDVTVVTEFFDCSAAPEELRQAVDDGRQWLEAMAVTLERLDAQATGREERRSRHGSEGPGGEPKDR